MVSLQEGEEEEEDEREGEGEREGEREESAGHICKEGVNRLVL